MSLVQVLRTREDAVPTSSRAGRRLGGIVVWAPSFEELELAILEGQQAIIDCARGHLSCVRAVLKKLVQERLSVGALDDRVFSGLLGSTLRQGQLDSATCSSKNDVAFKILVHESQFARWSAAQTSALEALRRRPCIAVRELEATLFGKRVYNSWSSTYHVLARLNYLGTVIFDTDDSCSLVEGL